jgi:hypothetical protein
MALKGDLNICPIAGRITRVFDLLIAIRPYEHLFSLLLSHTVFCPGKQWHFFLLSSRQEERIGVRSLVLY